MLTGTTTSAARMLHTTQPSVSRLLGQVQAATGLRLFDMHHGRLRPTTEAHELFDTIQRHFLGLESIETRVEAMRRSGSGILRIACTPALGLSVVPRAMSLFSVKYPDVQVNLQTLGSHYLREGLLHGLFDLVLSTVDLDSQSFQSECIHQSSAVCVMHPEHKLVGKKAIKLKDLEGVQLLTLDTDDDLAISLRNLMTKNDIKPASQIETTYSATICALAAQSRGIGIVNEYIAGVFADQVVIRPFLPKLKLETFLAYPSQRAPSQLAESFAAMIKKSFLLHAN